MTERFGSKFPHGRIAQTVEMKAGKEFGPERLKKYDVARALNLQEDQISDGEWMEISEFAVNAGADLIRAAIQQDSKDIFSSRYVAEIQRSIEDEDNDVGLKPFHDIFHAAETYRATKGKHAAARFAETDDRSKYVDPQSAVAELYPVLFFASPDMPKPLPVMFSTADDRKLVFELFKTVAVSDEQLKEMEDLLSTYPSDPAERQRQYESFLECIVIFNAQKQVKDINRNEIAMMREAMKSPPEHYRVFAARVFNEEWRENQRLFLDELLNCIRTRSE
jgi:hypothetical protein